MKCDNCIHLHVCKYHSEVVNIATKERLNPVYFTESDIEAQKTYNTIFSIMDDCKYFTENKEK